MIILLEAKKDLHNLTNKDLLLLAKYLGVPIDLPRNDLVWLITIKLHSTNKASMFKGNRLAVINLLDKISSVAKTRSEPSFVFSDSFIQRIQTLAREQETFNKSIKEYTIEEKKEHGGYLSKKEHELQKDPEWSKFEHLQSILTNVPVPATIEWIVDSYIKFGIANLNDVPTDLVPKIKMFNYLEQRGIVKDLHSFCGFNGCGNQPGLDELIDKYMDQIPTIDRGNIDILYDGPDFKLIKLLDKAAACYYGRGTFWCTAKTRTANRFDEYNTMGPLFILYPKHPKHPGERFQIHIPQNVIKDEQERNYEYSTLIKRFPKLAELLFPYGPVLITMGSVYADNIAFFEKVIDNQQLSEDDLLEVFEDTIEDREELAKYLLLHSNLDIQNDRVQAILQDYPTFDYKN